MTAIAICTEADRALIFTDAACYDTEGIILGFADKVHEVGNGRLFLAGRGSVWFMANLAKSLDATSLTIDDIERFGDDYITTCFEAAKATIGRWGPLHADVFIVGFSKEAGRLKVAQWSNAAPAGVPRFSMVSSVLAPDPDHEAMRRIRERMGAMTKATIDWAKLGLIVMLENRYAVGVEGFGAAGQFLVGGHVQRTTITAEGFEKDIVHRWPEDEIGTRIRPTPRLDPVAHVGVTPIANVSRAERRRLEKNSRKVSA